jgi:hypothetical protein
MVLLSQVRLVDAGIRHDEAKAVLDDDEVRPRAHDTYGFRQDQLDQPRVLAGLGGEPPRRGGGCDGGERHAPPLRLAHHLLRQGEHVARSRRQVRARQGIGQQRGEVVVRLDGGQAGKRRQAQRVAHPKRRRSSGSTLSP